MCVAIREEWLHREETHKESHIQVGGFERTKTTDIKGAGFKTVNYKGKTLKVKF